jgi:deoxyhypusine monooxygenase
MKINFDEIKSNNIEILFNKNSSGCLKIASIFELMNIADTESLQALYRCLKEDDCELVRHEAAFALGETAPEKNTTKLLKQTLKSDKSLVVKHECLMSLGTIADKKDIEFINPYTSSKIFEIKCSAQSAIDRINQTIDYEKQVPKNIDKYISILHDKKTLSQNTKIQILFQLMNIAIIPTHNDNNKALTAIGKSLTSDICRVVRHEAGFVLGEIGSDKAVKILENSLLNETTNITIHETLFALGTSGNKLSLPIIEKYITHKDYVVSQSAVIAKERILILKNPYSGARHFTVERRHSATHN